MMTPAASEDCEKLPLEHEGEQRRVGCRTQLSTIPMKNERNLSLQHEGGTATLNQREFRGGRRRHTCRDNTRYETPQRRQRRMIARLADNISYGRRLEEPFQWTNHTIRSKNRIPSDINEGSGEAPSVRQVLSGFVFQKGNALFGGRKDGKETCSLQTLMTCRRTARPRSM